VTAVGLAWWSLDGGPATTSSPVTGNVATTPAVPAPSPGAGAVAGQTPGEGPATMATDPDATSDTAVAQATTTDAAETSGAGELADTDEPADPATSTAAPAATPIADNPSPPDRQARTVQFVAPRGTRIIWTLDPNFESPITGQEPRQEKTR